MGYWVDGGSDGEGGKRPDTYYHNKNNGDGGKSSSGCVVLIIGAVLTGAAGFFGAFYGLQALLG